MKKVILIFFAAIASLSLNAQVYTWKAIPMNGTRTGVKASNVDNVKETMGEVKGHKFYAPNGKVFKGGSVWKVAKIMIDAQPQMKDVKTVIATSAKELHRGYPESELSNWFVDNLMSECQRLTGKKVDVGIVNFGGIRINMPAGDIYKEDIMSMFPFKNSLVYIGLKGKDLKYWLNWMAEKGFQGLGGVRCEAKDGKLISATINGENIDDNKVYGVATITFLLDGGDGLSLGQNAIEKIQPEGYLYDVMLDLVKRLQAQGKSVDSNLDGRVKIYTKDGNLLPTVKR